MGIISENTPVRKGCFGDFQKDIHTARKCGACMDFEECKHEAEIRKSFMVDLSSISDKTEVKAAKLDHGKRQYSLIIPQMMELMLPKLDNSDDNYWIRQAVLELSMAAHKKHFGDVLVCCHGAVEGLRLHLGSEKILDELTTSMEYGISKYCRNNWKKGMEWSRLLDAGMRHGIAILRGEDIDPDSGNTHLAHMLGSIHMLMGNIELGVGTDDITMKSGD